MRQYLQQQNYCKREEKCIKFIKHFNSKNNNLRRIDIFILVNK